MRSAPPRRRSAVLTALTAATLALAPGCSASHAFTRHMETTREAFGVGMAVGGVPSIIAALPVTLPLSSLLDGGAWGGDALGLLALPGLVPGGLVGVAFAAPVALFDLPIALLRAWADAAEATTAHPPAIRPSAPVAARAEATLLAEAR